MTRDDIDRQLLVLAPAELEELEHSDSEGERLDPLLRKATELCLDSQWALASSIASERPRTLTTVIVARQRRRWRWRLLLLAVFVPWALLCIVLFGSAIAALATAFFWR